MGSWGQGRPVCPVKHAHISSLFLFLWYRRRVCILGAIDRGSPCCLSILRNANVTCLLVMPMSAMSHFEFKKWPCRMSLYFWKPCRMSISSMSYVEFKKWLCRPVDSRVKGHILACPHSDNTDENKAVLPSYSQATQRGGAGSLGPWRGVPNIASCDVEFKKRQCHYFCNFHVVLIIKKKGYFKCRICRKATVTVDNILSHGDKLHVTYQFRKIMSPCQASRSWYLLPWLWN